MCNDVQALRTIHVNLYDLVAARDAGGVVPEHLVFSNVRDLRQYSRRERKIFRKSEAKEKTLLSCMLRHIFN